MPTNTCEKPTPASDLHRRISLSLATTVAVLTAGLSTLKADDALPAYKDSSRSAEARVNDLIGRMTVEEKVRQLDMYFGCEDFLEGSL